VAAERSRNAVLQQQLDKAGADASAKCAAQLDDAQSQVCAHCKTVCVVQPFYAPVYDVCSQSLVASNAWCACMCGMATVARGEDHSLCLHNVLAVCRFCNQNAQ
jgi:hypothetical protein